MSIYTPCDPNAQSAEQRVKDREAARILRLVSAAYERAGGPCFVSELRAASRRLDPCLPRDSCDEWVSWLEHPPTYQPILVRYTPAGALEWKLVK